MKSLYRYVIASKVKSWYTNKGNIYPFDMMKMKKILLYSCALSFMCIFVSNFGFVNSVNASDNTKQNTFAFYTMDKAKFKICHDSIKQNIGEYANLVSESGIGDRYWADQESWRSSIDNLSILLYWANNSDEKIHESIVNHFIKSQCRAISSGRKDDALLGLINGLVVYEALYQVEKNPSLKKWYQKTNKSFSKVLESYNCDKQAVKDYEGDVNSFVRQVLSDVMGKIVDYYSKYAPDHEREQLIGKYSNGSDIIKHDFHCYLTQFGVLCGRVYEVEAKESLKNGDSPKTMERVKSAFEKTQLKISNLSGNDNYKGNIDTLVNKGRFVETLQTEIKNKRNGTSKYSYDIGYWVNRILGKFDKSSYISLKNYLWQSDSKKVWELLTKTLPSMISGVCGERKLQSYDRFWDDIDYSIRWGDISYPLSPGVKGELYAKFECDCVEQYLKDRVGDSFKEIQDEECKKSCVNRLVDKFNFKNVGGVNDLDKRSFEDVDNFLERSAEEIRYKIERYNYKQQCEQYIKGQCASLAEGWNVSEEWKLKHSERLQKCFEIFLSVQTKGYSMEDLDDNEFKSSCGVVKGVLAEFVPKLVEENNNSKKIDISVVLYEITKLSLSSCKNIIQLLKMVRNALESMDVELYVMGKIGRRAGVTLRSSYYVSKFEEWLKKNMPDILRLSDCKQIDKYLDDHKAEVTNALSYLMELEPYEYKSRLASNIHNLVKQTDIELDSFMQYGELVDVYFKFIANVPNYLSVRRDNAKFDCIWAAAREFFERTLPLWSGLVNSEYCQQFGKDCDATYHDVCDALHGIFYDCYGTERPENKVMSINELKPKVVSDAVDYINEHFAYHNSRRKAWRENHDNRENEKKENVK